MFLNEVEDIFEVMDPAEFRKKFKNRFSMNWPNQLPVPISRSCPRSCLTVSAHTGLQVAERALYFWNNEYFCNLVSDNVETILPIMFAPLYENSKGHWNR